MTDNERADVEPTEQDIEQTPIGNIYHRIVCCPRTRDNCKMQRPDLERIFKADPVRPGDPRIERALFTYAPGPDLLPHEAETFHWIVKPCTELLRGTVYPDGSWLDGPSRHARGGWAFVVVDELGEEVACARGLPPSWITDIPGCEGWAVLQAAALSDPGRVAFRSDCQPCVKACKGSLKTEANAKRKHARLYNALLPIIEDTADDDIVWMPAHTKASDVGIKKRGDGRPLTSTDRAANDRADTHAKLAVAEHRVPEAVRERDLKQDKVIEQVARWIGHATFSANNQPFYPKRDTAAQKPKFRKHVAARSKASIVGARPANLGGHAIVKSHGGFQCSICEVASSKWNIIAPQRCKGSKADAWDKVRTEFVESIVGLWSIGLK